MRVRSLLMMPDALPARSGQIRARPESPWLTRWKQKQRRSDPCASGVSPFDEDIQHPGSVRSVRVRSLLRRRSACSRFPYAAFPVLPHNQSGIFRILSHHQRDNNAVRRWVSGPLAKPRVQVPVPPCFVFVTEGQPLARRDLSSTDRRSPADSRSAPRT